MVVNQPTEHASTEHESIEHVSTERVFLAYFRPIFGPFPGFFGPFQAI